MSSKLYWVLTLPLGLLLYVTVPDCRRPTFKKVQAWDTLVLSLFIAHSLFLLPSGSLALSRSLWWRMTWSLETVTTPDSSFVDPFTRVRVAHRRVFCTSCLTLCSFTCAA